MNAALTPQSLWDTLLIPEVPAVRLCISARCTDCGAGWDVPQGDPNVRCRRCGSWAVDFEMEFEPMDDGTDINTDNASEWDRFVGEVCDELCKLDPSRDDRGDFTQEEYTRMNVAYGYRRSALSVAEELAGYGN